jgi:hypothetical protein
MSSPNVPELLPFSVYETSRNATIPRVALAGALFWFIAMTIEQVATTRDSLGVTLIVNAFGALLFWLLLAIGIRWLLNRIVRQLYDGTSPWMPPMPPGQYDARLSCSVMRGITAVGGHLYVGRQEWVFVPHTKNLPRHRNPLHWEHPERLSLSTEPVRSAWLQLLLGKLPDRLVISHAGLRDQLLVPDAQRVCEELDRFRSA